MQCNRFRQVTDLAATLRPCFTAGRLSQKHHFALGRRNQAEYQLHNGRFACTVVSCHADALASLENQIDLVDGLLAAKLLGHVS